MKRILGLAICLCLVCSNLALAGISFNGSSSSGTSTASDCSSYTAIGQLCQDTDDGKLYKGTGAGVEEIASGSALSATDVTGYTEDTTPTGDDLVVTVNDPSGSAALRKVTRTNFFSSYLVQAGANNILTYTGNYTLGVTLTGNTTVTFPTSGTLLTTTGSAANLTSFPTLNQNTTGTAANLSGTPALPDGTTATTQAASDNSTKLATTAYVDSSLPTAASLHVDDILTALGIASEAVNFGAFTGSTIADNQTAKAALQALETAVETKVSTSSAANYTEPTGNALVKKTGAGTLGTSYIVPAGPTADRTITLDDADQTVAARNRDNTFTGANTIGDGGDDQRILMRVNTNDGTWSGITMNLTCHETIAFGQLVFVNSDGEAALADADAAATMPAVGVAVVGGNAAATCTVLTHGTITETDWAWTAGQRLYVSESAGSIENTLSNISDTNDVVQIVGVALSGDTILFNPSLVEVVLE